MYNDIKVFIMELKIGNVLLKSNVIVAPLAGYTNKVYREIMHKAGAGMVCCEMVSAKGLFYENKKTFDMLEVGDEGVCSMQIFGYEVSDLVNAAKILDKETKCDIIDINMGCPVKKVTATGAGSSLLKDVNHIYDIVKAVCDNVQKPVTVKIRAGWDHNHINCVEVAKAIEKGGASAIIIHGRTKSDLYTGKCNLDYIKMVKDAVSIPVIGNGDIKSYDDALKMIEYTKCDGIMIGRASLGNPWLISEIVAKLDGKEYIMPTNKDKIDMLIYHFNELVKLKGKKIAVLEMRSMAGWYVKGMKNIKEYKRALVNVKTKDEFLELIDIYLVGEASND